MKRIAIFASGSGSNAEIIARYFSENPKIEVSLVVSNKRKAFVLERAKGFNIPIMIIDREMFYHSDEVVNRLLQLNIDIIVLAGFLWLVPLSLIKAFPQKIINIHPALLPEYGGKGMYGMNVHKAVLENKETETGMTVHFVSEKYDEGGIIFQSSCDISDASTPEEIATEVLKLEHKYYPIVIESLLAQQDEEQ